MKVVVTGHDDFFGPWIAQRTNGEWVEGRGTTIGLWELGVGPIGAVQFADCNDASVVMHCAGDGRRWLNREFLWYAFHYPFEELGVRKIISPVEGDNLDCQRFIENLGFVREATLKDAAPKGDLILYTLRREDCKWLTLREKYRGKTKGTEGS